MYVYNMFIYDGSGTIVPITRGVCICMLVCLFVYMYTYMICLCIMFQEESCPTRYIYIYMHTYMHIYMLYVMFICNFSSVFEYVGYQERLYPTYACS